MKDQIREHNCAVNGAFILDGMYSWHDAVHIYTKWAEWSDTGLVGLVNEVTQYASYIEDKYEECLAVEPEWGLPGVFDYEVTTMFGWWFAEHLVGNSGQPPWKQDCHAEIDRLVAEFMSDDEAKP